MTSTRQDAWTQDEDLLLAEVVLRNIREGGTQLKAFEEVGKQLSRTAAACGFRWNSFVRKQYKSGIELAKKQRKELKKQSGKTGLHAPIEIDQEKIFIENNQDVTVQSLTFEQVHSFLAALYEKAGLNPIPITNIQEYEMKIKNLEKQIYQLAAENEKLEKELKAMENNYRSLVQIFERARNMFLLSEEESKKQVKIKVVEQGELESLEK